MLQVGNLLAWQKGLLQNESYITLFTPGSSDFIKYFSNMHFHSCPIGQVSSEVSLLDKQSLYMLTW